MRKHGIKRTYRRDLPYTFYGLTKNVRNQPVVAMFSVVIEEGTEVTRVNDDTVHEHAFFEPQVTFLGTAHYLEPDEVRALQVLSKRVVNERLGQLIDAGLLNHARVNEIPVAWLEPIAGAKHSGLRRNVLRQARPLHLMVARFAAMSLGHRARRLGQSIEDQIAEAVRIMAALYESSAEEMRVQMGSPAVEIDDTPEA